MTAFLARLAAKAVGQIPVAQPRLPSLFEAASEPQASQRAFEVIDDEVVVGLEPTATPAPTDWPAGDATSRAVSPAASSPTVGESTRGRATQPTEPPRSGQRHDESGRPGPRRTRTVVADQVTRSSDAAPVPQPLPTVRAVPLSLAMPVASRSADGTTRSASPSAPEPPAVRVHIGRLEIRANPPDAAPARAPEGREEAARGVSLADYLRGGR